MKKNCSEQCRKRYWIAVYMALLFLSLFLIVLAFFWLEDIWRSLAINLATELMGAVLLFFIVKIAFQTSDDESITDILMSLRQMLSLRAEDFFVDKLPDLEEFEEHIEKSKSINMCGVTLATTLFTLQETLRDFLAKPDAKFRVLIIEPSPEALTFARLRSRGPGPAARRRNYYKDKWTEAVDILNEWQREYGDKVQVKFMPFPPSFGMYQFELPAKGESMIAVNIYPHGVSSRPQLYFFLKREKDYKWFRYFEKQFEHLWEISKSWKDIKQYIDWVVDAESFL